jgi:hypothetical protein
MPHLRFGAPVRERDDAQPSRTASGDADGGVAASDHDRP